MTARGTLPSGSRSIDRAIDLVLARIIDDLIDSVELWHRAGCDDARWVAKHWHRTVGPCLGVALPARVLAAADARGVHEALLEWQTAVAHR